MTRQRARAPRTSHRGPAARRRARVRGAPAAGGGCGWAVTAVGVAMPHPAVQEGNAARRRDRQRVYAGCWPVGRIRHTGTACAVSTCAASFDRRSRSMRRRRRMLRGPPLQPCDDARAQDHSLPRGRAPIIQRRSMRRRPGSGSHPASCSVTTGQAGWMRSGMTSSLAKRSRCRAAYGYARITLSTADGIRLRRRLGECWPRSARRTRRSSTE